MNDKKSLVAIANATAMAAILSGMYLQSARADEYNHLKHMERVEHRQAVEHALDGRERAIEKQVHNDAAKDARIQQQEAQVQAHEMEMMREHPNQAAFREKELLQKERNLQMRDAAVKHQEHKDAHKL